MSIIATRSRQPWNKGKLVGQTPPATTERYLGHPSKASNCGKNQGAGSLRSGHRQQTSSLRLNHAPRARCRPWRARIITSHVMQQKTQRPAQFKITEQTQSIYPLANTLVSSKAG